MYREAVFYPLSCTWFLPSLIQGFTKLEHNLMNSVFHYIYIYIYDHSNINNVIILKFE